MADPVVHDNADGNAAILRYQIRNLDFKGEKTSLVCRGQLPVEIYFGGMGYCIKTQYLTLSVFSAQKCREFHGSFVISPAVMIPVSRVIFLVIVRSRNADQLHCLGLVPDIPRFLLIP